MASSHAPNRSRIKITLGNSPTLKVLFVFSDVGNYWEQSLFFSMVDSLYNKHGHDHDISYTCLSGQSSPELLEYVLTQAMSTAFVENDICVASAPWVFTRMRTRLGSYNTMPTIFSGMVTPDRFGALKEFGKSTENTTGVVMQVPSYDDQAQTIKDLRPDTTSMVVPYDTNLGDGGVTSAHAGATATLSRAWQALGGTSTVIPLDGLGDIGGTIVKEAPEKSIVNLSLESSVLAQMPRIVQQANKHGLTLYAHDRISVRRGAALGSGGSGSSYGPHTAQMISQVLVERSRPKDIPPAVVVEDKHVCFQNETIEQQGIAVAGEMMRKMQMLPIEMVE